MATIKNTQKLFYNFYLKIAEIDAGFYFKHYNHKNGTREYKNPKAFTHLFVILFALKSINKKFFQFQMKRKLASVSNRLV